MNRGERRARWIAQHRSGGGAAGAVQGSSATTHVGVVPSRAELPELGRLRPASMQLHVEALVLHGFKPSERYQIGAAFEGELARLVASQGVPPLMTRGGDIDRLEVGQFSMRPGARAPVVGVQVAQAVYGGPTR